jgi:hypothetical protein
MAASSPAWRRSLIVPSDAGGFHGIKLGPANRGRRLDDAERQAIEQKMRDEGRL